MKKFLLLVAIMATFIGVSAQTPYAYNLYSEVYYGCVDFYYSLNTQAQAVQLQFFDGENEIGSIDMAEEMLTAGNHYYRYRYASNAIEFPVGKTISWKVAVTGAPIETPVEITDKVLKFYSPAGVAVDVDPESKKFGTMYVTESYASASTDYYTAPDNGSVGIGLYQFDPQFNGIKNNEGKYGFSCGMQSGGTSLVDWRPSRIQISDDGRMFILSQRVNTGYPLYEINRYTLQATPLFEGTLDTSNGIVNNGDVEVAAGVGVAFDVIGSGNDLKLVMMTCTPGTTTDITKYKTNEYNIGVATTWGEAPSRNISAFDNKVINYAGVNLAYDGANGLWMSQWRGAPSEAEPSYAHANLETDEIDELITDIYSRNGGMAFNKDHTLMVRGEGYSKKLVVYAVDNGSLTKLYEYSCPSFTGWNHFAFDYANNIIACDNGAEVFGMIQLPNETAVITPCSTRCKFRVSSIADIEEMYVVGTFNGWSQEEGRVELVSNDSYDYEYVAFVEFEAGDEFKIIAPNGNDGWQWFGGLDADNLGYFLVNNDILNNPYNEIVLNGDANFKVEESGKYKITVRKMIPTKGSRFDSWDFLTLNITKNNLDAIEAINSDSKTDNAWYNMNGVRFEKEPIAPGIYIHNSKKVIVK